MSTSVIQRKGYSPKIFMGGNSYIRSKLARDKINLIKKEVKMGECGCGSVEPEYIFKINNNLYLILYLMRPCNYCDAGFTIEITKMDKEEFEDWDYQEFYKDKIYKVKEMKDPLFFHICGGPQFLEAAKKYVSEECLDELQDTQYQILEEDFRLLNSKE